MDTVDEDGAMDALIQVRLQQFAVSRRNVVIDVVRDFPPYIFTVELDHFRLLPATASALIRFSDSYFSRIISLARSRRTFTFGTVRPRITTNNKKLMRSMSRRIS